MAWSAWVADIVSSEVWSPWLAAATSNVLNLPSSPLYTLPLGPLTIFLKSNNDNVCFWSPEEFGVARSWMVPDVADIDIFAEC